MKDLTQAEMQKIRFEGTAFEAIAYCLQQLDTDKSNNVVDTIAGHLTFERLIGTLLVARTELIAAKDREWDEKRCRHNAGNEQLWKAPEI